MSSSRERKAPRNFAQEQADLLKAAAEKKEAGRAARLERKKQKMAEAKKAAMEADRERKRIEQEKAKAKGQLAKVGRSSPKRAEGSPAPIRAFVLPPVVSPPIFDPVEFRRQVSEFPLASRRHVWDSLGSRQFDAPRLAPGAVGDAIDEVPAYYSTGIWELGSSRRSGDRRDLADKPLHTLAHDGDVRGLSWSPDHRFLATCSDIGTINIWQVPFPTAEGQTTVVEALACVPPGNSWKLVMELHDDAEVSLDEFYCCAFDPTGRYLFAAGKLSAPLLWSDRDGTNRILPTPVKIFDLTTGAVVSYLWGHAEEIWDLVLLQRPSGDAKSPMINYCITVGEDGHIIRWQLKNDWSELVGGPQLRVQTARADDADAEAESVGAPAAESASADGVLPSAEQLVSGSAALQFCVGQVSTRKDIVFLDDDSVCGFYRIQVLPDSANRFIICACDDGLKIFEVVVREDEPQDPLYPVVPIPRRWRLATFLQLHASQCDDVCVIPNPASEVLYQQYRSGAFHGRKPFEVSEDGDTEMQDSSAPASVTVEFKPLPKSHVFFVASRGVEALDNEGFLVDSDSACVIVSCIEIPDIRGGTWRRTEVRKLMHVDYVTNSPLVRMTCSPSGLIVAPTNNLAAVFLWSVLTGELVQVLQIGTKKEREKAPVMHANLFHPSLPILLSVSPTDLGSVISANTYRDIVDQVRTYAASKALEEANDDDDDDAEEGEGQADDFDYEAELAAALGGNY